MSSPLLLQQCLACLARLIWMILEIGSRWSYSCCSVGCCFKNLFNMAHSFLVQLLSSFFSMRLVSVHVVHPYSSINTTVAWKKLRFISSDKSDFCMTDCLSMADYAFTSCVLILFSVDETLLPREVNFSPSFKEPLVRVEMSPVWFLNIHMYFLIIIKSRWHCGFLWLSLSLSLYLSLSFSHTHSIRPYHQSLLTALPNSIHCTHRPDVNRFSLVVLASPVVPHILFVLFRWFWDGR